MAAIVRRFQFSVTTSYILEFGNLYVRFYKEGSQIKLSGEPYEIVSPYFEDDLLSLQFVQVRDVMYIVHPDYPVYSLTRDGDTDWTLAETDFDQPPFLDENLTTTTIAASATTGNGITLTASTSIFESGHVDSWWRIGHFREADTLSHDIDADENSATIEVFGPYVLRSYGTWDATLEFQKSLDGGSTWDTVHKVVGESDQNLEIRGEAKEECLMRVAVSGFASATDARATIETEDAVIYGIVQITAVASGTSATANVLSDYPLYATAASEIWSEGAWSEFRGYPRSCTLHEQRLCFGGTDHQPSTIWGSAVDDFENFERGTDDDDSYVFSLAGLELNAIQWMASLKALLVGTTGSEWRIIGDELGAIISPTKVSAKQFSFKGSEYVQAENTGEVVMFIERKARRLLDVRPEGDSFVVTDLTLLSEHLTKDGYIVQMSWQRDARILWAVTSDGRLLGMTYNREQAVLGWHRHLTDGSFRSVAAIYGAANATDEVWFVIERTIESAQVFHVERFNPEVWSAREDYFGVDSGLSYEGSPANVFAGLDHLAGETVAALADGVVYTGLVVTSGGQVSLPTGVTASTVHIGLPFTHNLSPFRLDADTQLGVHLGRSKRIDNVHLRLYRAAGVEYNFGGTTYPLKLKDGETDSGTFLIGSDEGEDVKLDNDTGNTFDPRLNIRSSDPLPCTVQAIRIGYGVSST